MDCSTNPTEALPRKLVTHSLTYLSLQVTPPVFLDLKRREEQKTLQVNKRNKETNNIPFSMGDLNSVIQITNNYVPGPNDNYDAMHKHLSSEGKETLINI